MTTFNRFFILICIVHLLAADFAFTQITNGHSSKNTYKVSRLSIMSGLMIEEESRNIKKSK